jgi:hypothetical protein
LGGRIAGDARRLRTANFWAGLEACGKAAVQSILGRARGVCARVVPCKSG